MMNIISCLGKRRPFLTHGIKGILKIWFVPQSSTLKLDFNKHDSAEFFMCNARSDCFGIPISFWQSFNSQMYTSRLLWIQSFFAFSMLYNHLDHLWHLSETLYIHPTSLGRKEKKKTYECILLRSVLRLRACIFIYPIQFDFLPH